LIKYEGIQKEKTRAYSDGDSKESIKNIINLMVDKI